MEKKEERKQRLSLTLLFSAVVLVVFLSVLLLVAVGLYLLVSLRAIPEWENGISASTLVFTFACASLAVGVCVTLLLSRFLLKPVNHLLDIMNRLASGDFSARIRPSGYWTRHPGIAELADSFNKMAEELQGTEMLRSDFVNNFSHEFKTPIVSIAGFAKLLKHEQLTPRQAEYVGIIEEESLRLSAMATNVLNMTKVENQNILTDVTTYNLSEQLRSCILLLSSKWEKKEIEFSVDFQEHDVTGSAELLKHVWINLIDNAVKFSSHGGMVEITITEERDWVEVAVTNTGIAIAPEKQRKIFQKFYQADESHSTQGSGVGLAIVKKVVELHRGSVSVRCADGLTTFCVRLPG